MARGTAAESAEQPPSPVAGVTGATGNPQRSDVEHDWIHPERTTSQQDRTKHDEHVEQLSREVAKLREELERKNSELEMSSTELGVLRALSAIREPSTAIEHRPNRLKAGVQFLLWRGLGVLGRMGYRIERSAQAEAIRSSGLFDASWYLERYPDVAKTGVDPLFHYLEFGAWEGRDPHPLFDQVWYRATYPEVQRQKQTPLGHFVTVGAATGHNPNPLFHTIWYAASHTDIGAVNPLRHYVEHAAEEGRNPNPLFDSAWYLKDNPDVAATGVNPLAHYIHHGIAEARDPHPAFDTDWYVKQYEHVAISGMDALEHYLTFGVVRGYRTRPSNRGGDGRAKTRRQRAALRSPDEGVIEKATLARQIESESSHAGASIDIYRSRMVLRGTSPVAATFTGHIGVFVHLFYDDLASEIAASLLNIPFNTKVYISTNSKEKKETINAAFRQFGFTPVIKVLPNRGWDIAPFLLGFADEMGDHEICLKLHGKRSRHPYENSDRGNAWRKHLLSRLLAHPRNVGFIVDSFSAHPDLGIVMPRHWRGIARQVKVIGPNYLHMRRLLKQISVSISPDQPIEFPSGSMFWFRKAALQPLLDLGLSWSDFARCRPRDRDATFAHGIERCILMFAAHAGYRWAFMPRGWVRRSLPSQGRSGGLQSRSDPMADFG